MNLGSDHTLLNMWIEYSVLKSVKLLFVLSICVPYTYLAYMYMLLLPFFEQAVPMLADYSATDMFISKYIPKMLNLLWVSKWHIRKYIP